MTTRRRYDFYGLMCILFGLSVVSLEAVAEEIKIDAGEGISWQPEQQRYWAQGRVRIINDSITAWSNEAMAYYADDAPDNIIRLVLQGAVRITGDNVEMQGDQAEVQIEAQVITITGQHLRVDTSETVLSAEDYFRYRAAEGVLEAQGEVVILRGIKKISADQIRVEWGTAAARDVIQAVYATGNVEADDGVSDPRQRLYLAADRGLYRPQEGTIRVCGQAVVLRESNTLRGECAHYDINTRNFQFLGAGELTSPLPVMADEAAKEATDSAVNAATQAVSPNPSAGRTRLIFKTKN